ncbi:MAG: CBS domain-containing protein [Leptospiraceae bacterium]|nr:CBS domain-containing protein [Leptospiraceae bacterium]
MFIWVTQGLVEPYIPKVKPDSIKKINPLHPGVADKSIEVGDPEDTIQITHYKGNSFTSSANIDVADIYSQEQSKPKEERKQVYYAKDIMTVNLITISPIDLIAKVENLFHENPFRHMPVVDSSFYLQGILSERDLLKFTIQSLRSSELEVIPRKVEEIMQIKVLSAFPETPIREIARIMFEEKVGAVPILNKESREIVGIITRSDILKQVMNNPPLDLYT